MDMQTLKQKVADIISDNLDWDHVAEIIAEDMGSDVEEKVAEALNCDIDADTIAQTIISSL